MVIRVVSTSAETTRALGAALASDLGPGAVIVLAGDLGSGKTVFAQGVASGLGVTDRVVSPTFAIAREYTGRVRVHHLDVYRLDRVQEAIDLGLDELFDDAVTLIEWGDGVRDLLPPDRLEVELVLAPAVDPGDANSDPAVDDIRMITITPFGADWIARAAELRDRLGAIADRGDGLTGAAGLPEERA